MEWLKGLIRDQMTWDFLSPPLPILSLIGSAFRTDEEEGEEGEKGSSRIGSE